MSKNFRNFTFKKKNPEPESVPGLHIFRSKKRFLHPYYKWTICSQIDFERHVTIIFRVCGIQAIWILGDSDLFIHPLSTLMNMHEDNHGWENIRQSWQNGHLHYDKQFIVLHLVGYWLSQIIYFSREIFKIYPYTYLETKLA